MTGLLVRWVINALGLLLIANIIENITLQGFGAALIAVLVLGIVNAVIRPILLLLTLPLNILTLGLFTFVVNGFILYMVASVVDGFQINGFLAAIVATILLSLISALANKLVK
ncbi:phage holin family protein [Desulfitibacter alkalitolerans]|uniref:phage holin family protein n=1 Tax=Desulfitibacter alkalitolerans TaxID=264641 RepID=UPI000487F258|nr:phage holin family protein [Desulfitibacter alkalitolerans]